MILKPNIISSIRNYATAYKIVPELLQAFVEVESSGNPYAMRYEPGTARYISDENVAKCAEAAGLSKNIERDDQMSSWGLMQVMGFNARQLGFTEDLGNLRDIGKGLNVGCQWLRKLQKMFDLPVGVNDVLDYSPELACAYNHGHPEKLPNGTWFVQEYVDKIHKAYLDAKKTVPV